MWRRRKSDCHRSFLSKEDASKRGNGASLKCGHADCNYKGTFPRQWELQRHVAAKHEKVKPFWCPVSGCVKGSRPPAFTRPDKLTAHIRAVHQGKGARAVCPAATCGGTPLELDLLGVHVQLQHLTTRHDGVIGGMLRAVANAASTDWRPCPLWSCKKRVSLEDFPSHLLSHPRAELIVASAELAGEGYRLVKSGCYHSEEEMSIRRGWCDCEMTSVEVECPICGSGHSSGQMLMTHIESAHIRVGEDVKDFRQRILALIGAKASHKVGEKMWRDIVNLN